MKTLILLSVFLAAAFGIPIRPKIGYSRPSVGITNGQNATEGQFPYEISFQSIGIWSDDYEHECGGSIVAPSWIVTAGHCLTQLADFDHYRVVAGITELDEENEERQNVAIAQIIVHPDFAGGVGPNDIGLIKLATPLVLGDLVQIIGVSTYDDTLDGDATLSGWGSASTEKTLMPNHLQTADLPIITYEECNAAVWNIVGEDGSNPLDENANICTGPLSSGLAACSGDSGSPLAQNNTLIGVVSWGFIPCGEVGAPSAYTRVSRYVGFINQYITDSSK